MKLLLSLGACILSLGAIAQENVLPEVEVTDRFGEDDFGKLIRMNDSLAPFTKLSDRLQSVPEIYVKHYSSGSLATVSIRGTQAQHTDVIWNGLSMRSPMLGLQDLSLFSSENQQAQVHIGCQAMIYGSGNTGGAIVLKSALNAKPGAKLALNAGSFGQLGGGATVNYQLGSWMGQTNISYAAAEENFPFRVNGFDTVFRMPNGMWQTTNISQDLRWFQKDSVHYDLHYAGTWMNRHIPPVQNYAPFSNYPSTFQSDRLHRFVVERNEMGAKWNNISRIGFVAWDILYKEDRSDISAPSAAHSYYAQTEFNRSTKKHSVILGFDYRLDAGNAESYREINHTANIFSEWIFAIRDLSKIKATVRSDFSFEKLYIPVGSLGFSHQNKSKTINTDFTISHNLRLPTLNDRFWNPGGNPDLLPEQSWAAEWNGEWRFGQKSVLAASVYTMLIDDYILWLPAGNYFSPLNARKVRNSGLELSYEKSSKYIDISSGMALTDAVQLESILDEVSTSGRQVPYVPTGRVFASTTLKYKDFRLAVNWNYNGRTYIQIDNSAYMPYFQTLDLSLAYFSKEWSVQLQLFNITNVEYYVLPSRPMPGFNAAITLKYQVEWKK